MAEVVNLRLARKVKARAAKEAQANTNRAAFGRTKAEKSAATIEAQRNASLLDGAKRDHRRDDG
ncbi:DUF4169 family protein [Sphingomonas koreensis]|nr:DUF4169 family protein [Sphingomonas koreensis]